LTGCGGGDDEGSADTDTTATETTDTGETTGAENELYGTVGPGFTITLTTEDGEAVTSVPAGSYKIEIDDKSDIHNFHLTGPGDVDVSTEVGEVTKVTWEVDLQEGTYNYVCDPHASTMNGSFEVTS
jgi:plastocyanin